MKSVDFYLESTSLLLHRVELSRSKWFSLKEKLAASAKKIDQLESKLAQTVQQRDALYSKLDKLLKLEELDDDSTDQTADTSVNQIKHSNTETNFSGEFITLEVENADGIRVCTIPCRNMVFDNSLLSETTIPTTDGAAGSTDLASCTSTIPASFPDLRSDQKVIDNDSEKEKISSNENQKLLSDSQPEPSIVHSDSQLDTSQKDTDQENSVENEETPLVENEIKSLECPENSAETPKDDFNRALVSQSKPEVDSNDNIGSKTQPDRQISSFSHLRRSKKRLWECSICDQRFNRSEILTKHIMKIHGTDRSTLKCISQQIKSLLKINLKKKRNMKRKSSNSSVESVVNQKQSHDQEKNTESTSINYTVTADKNNQAGTKTDDSKSIEEKKPVESSTIDKSEESPESADGVTIKDEHSCPLCPKLKQSKRGRPKSKKTKQKTSEANKILKRDSAEQKTFEIDKILKRNSKMTLRRKSNRYNFRQLH